MQHSEKNKIGRHDVPAVKDRIFQRFMGEHSLNVGIIQNHPQYQYSRLEEAGVMAKLARLDDEIGFDALALCASNCLQILAELERAPWLSEPQISRMQHCSSTLVPMLELFCWLEAYGPKPAEPV